MFAELLRSVNLCLSAICFHPICLSSFGTSITHKLEVLKPPHRAWRVYSAFPFFFTLDTCDCYALETTCCFPGGIVLLLSSITGFKIFPRLLVCGSRSSVWSFLSFLHFDLSSLLSNHCNHLFIYLNEHSSPNSVIILSC